ncbi:hypothetical protein ACLB1E_25470 [Escherichia coli]
MGRPDWRTMLAVAAHPPNMPTGTVFTARIIFTDTQLDMHFLPG